MTTPLQRPSRATSLRTRLAVLAIAVSGLVAQGCSDPSGDGTLLAVVQLEEAVRATCVRVEVLGGDGAPVASAHFETEKRRDYRVALYRGALAEQVAVRAVALWGTGCQEPLAFNGQTPPVGARFVPGTVEEVALPLRAPDATLDADRDGFVSTLHRGPDCNDGNAAAYPGAAERCMSLEDLDCNGLAGCADPACSGKVCAAPPAALAFLGEPPQLTAGACSSALFLESRDSFGNAAPLDRTTQITLGTVPALELAFFADPACEQPVESLTLGGGEARVAFHVRGTKAGPVQLTAQAAGLSDATQSVQIVPAAPSALHFATPPRASAAGACSERVEVLARDAFDNPSAVTASLPLALAAQPAGDLSFFSDETCEAPVEWVAFEPGTFTARFHFRGTRSGPVQVGVSAVGLGEAMQVQTVGLGPPESIELLGAPQVLTAGECSQAIRVRGLDAYQNPSAPGTSAVLTLGAAPPEGATFHLDASCGAAVTTVPWPAGSPEITFHVRFRRPGTPTVHLDTPFGQTAHTFTVETGPAASLHFTSMPQTITAGACSSALTVERRDAEGNPTATGGALPVSVSVTGALSSSLELFSDATCTTPLQTLSLQGAVGSFYVSGTIAGAGTLTLSSTGVSGAAQPVTITAGPPSLLTFSGIPPSVEAGGCSPEITLHVRDAHGNPTPAGSLGSIALLADPSARFAFYSDATCTTPVTSLALPSTATSSAFRFRSEAAGTVELRGMANGLQPAEQSVTIVPGPPVRVRFATGPQIVPVNQCSAPVTAQLADGSGNPTPSTQAVAVALSATPQAGLTFYADAACSQPVTTLTIAAGNREGAFHFRTTSVGPVALELGAAGLMGDTQTHTIDQAAAVLAFTSAPQSPWAGECSGPLTIESRDAQGVATPMVGNVIVSLTALPETRFGFFLDAACTQPATEATIPDGESSAHFHVRGLTGGPVTITATAASETILPASQLVTVIPASTAGTCTIRSGQGAASCDLDNPVPDMARTLLFYGGSGNHKDAQNALARCWLQTPSNIRCTRGNNGGPQIRIGYSTVFLPQQVQVRHLQTACNSMDNVTDLPLSPPVANPASTFLLHGMHHGVKGYGQDVFATVELESAGNVRITRRGGNCDNGPRYAVQVVEWTGAQVVRGTLAGGIPDGATQSSASGLPALTPDEATRTFLLYTWQSGAGNMNGRMVQGSLPDATGALFERAVAQNAGVGALHYERVTLPPGNVVHAAPISLANNAASGTATIPAVDLTRSVAFAGGMSLGGSGGGMGAQGNARPENMIARFALTSPTEVQATRAQSENTASWTAWVIQFAP